MVEKTFKIELQVDEKGNAFPVVHTTEQQKELLKMLSESDSWRLYAQVLESAKQGYVHLAMGMNNPNEILKTMGLIAGINFAINQLGVLMVSYKKQQAKSVESLPKNSPPSLG